MPPDIEAIDRPAAMTGLPSRLDDGLASLGLALPGAARARLMAFLSLLQQWNQVYNLTSVRDPGDMLVVHLLDALSILPLVEASIGVGRLLDVGSGAGIPGIPLAIARATWNIDSIDAVAKKIGFQIRAKQVLDLPNFQPRHDRVEALTLLEPPAVIVARAFASLGALVNSVAHLADEGTAIIAMKGVEPTTEIAELPASWRVDAMVPLDVPFLGAARCAVVLRRV